MNIGQLKTKVADWLDRTDLDSQIGDFVELAAQRIYRTARTPTNERLLAGSATDGKFELPESFIAVRWIQVNDVTLTAAPGSEVYPDVAGQPQFYGRVGDFIWFYPRQTTDFVMSYFIIEDFSSDSDEPALLQVATDAFLYGALVEAAPYLQDDQRLAVWESKYQLAMGTLKVAADDADLGDVVAIRSVQ